jgi:hypothetical protein
VNTEHSDQQAWREERRAAIFEHQAALDRRRAAESAQAQELLDDFVATLRERGVEPVDLRARVNGRSAYRTGLSGWYLRANRSLAVDTDGRFFILDTASTPWGRLRGVALSPSPPPLQVGVGARDGESMSLSDLLALRLSELAPRNNDS